MQPDTIPAHHLEQLFGVSRELMCVLRRDGTVALVNPAFKNTLGWSTDELAGLKILDIVHHDDLGRVFQMLTRMKQANHVKDVELRILSKRGTYIPATFDVTAAAVGDEFYAVGKVTGEETEGGEEVSRVTGGPPRSGIESLLPTVGRWHVDVRTGDVVWSDSMYGLLGYDKESFEPKRHTAFERLSEDDRSSLFGRLKEALQSYRGEVVQLPQHDGIVVTLPDGRVRHLQCVAAVTGTNDAPTYMHGYLIDVSDKHVHAQESQKQAQKNKEAEQELGLYQAALALVREPVCLLDVAGEVQYANPEVTVATGYTQAEIIGKQVGACWAVEGPDRQYYRQMVEAAVSTRTQQVSIVRNRHKEGKEYMSEVHIDPIFGTDDQLVGLVARERTIS